MVGNRVTSEIAGLGITEELGHQATGGGERAVDRLTRLLGSSDVERELRLSEALDDVVVYVERLPFPLAIARARSGARVALPPRHGRQGSGGT